MKVTLFAWEMNFNIFVEKFFLLIGEDRGGNDTDVHDLFFCLEMVTEWMLYCLPVYFFLVGSGSLGRSQRGEWFLGNLVVCLEKLFSLCFTFNFSLLRQQFEVTVGLFLRFEAGSLLLGVRFVQSRLCREIFATHACTCSVVFTSVTPWTVTASLLCPWDFPIKNTGVIWHFLLQGIFPIQSLNLHLLCPVHWLVSFC